MPSGHTYCKERQSKLRGEIPLFQQQFAFPTDHSISEEP